MNQKTLTFLIFALLILFASIQVNAEETATVKFILTGDLPEFTPEKGRGGYAKLSSVVIQEKALETNSFLIHAGDAYSPSLLSGLDKGKSSVEMLNAIGVDYMVLGNHEWDFGPKITRERIWESNFPILASNVIDKDGYPLDGTLRTTMLKVGPFRWALPRWTRLRDRPRNGPVSWLVWASGC